ncbi:MAG TPA: homoserine O-acetyltransferase, partial [Verrucomicrobia bacterium]|nr:homoserine O-acetyltransferase [Verrucomicrobiota bacterium]
FNLADGAESLDAAFASMQAKALVMAFSSDWLYPPKQNKEAVAAMLRAGKEATYVEIDSDYGHDAFLLEADEISKFIRAFIRD